MPGIFEEPDYSLDDLYWWETETGCSICFAPGGDLHNPVVFCKSCDVGVHP